MKRYVVIAERTAEEMLHFYPDAAPPKHWQWDESEQLWRCAMSSELFDRGTAALAISVYSDKVWTSYRIEVVTRR